MSNSATFSTLFGLLEKYIVEVPKVQRDYAQGRVDETTNLVRKNLLLDIKAAILREEPPLDLNFVYGKVNKEGNFIPIDGQQRLTTLFLLYVYAYYTDEDKTPLLQKFTYETRKSSRDFLEQLVANRKKIFSSPNMPSYEIEDSEWFVSGWKHDPTIRSALVMLDDIRNTFVDICDLADRLSSEDYKPIVFKFLDIKDLGMEDSLYIKLNARGKPLTLLETFKARLLGNLKELRLSYKDEFEHLFDGKWTDFFWDGHKGDFDRMFLAFFGVLLRNHGIIYSDYSNWSNTFEFDKFDEELFSTTYHTLNYLSDNPSNTLARNLFFNALSKYCRYQDRVLFHSVTTYLNKTKGNDNGNFDQWLRILKNLTLNSQIDDVRSYKRAIESINNLANNCGDLLSYFADEGNVSGFSAEQIIEERVKARLIQGSSDYAHAIYEAEKHPYFSGQIRSALYYAKDSNDNYDLGIFNAYWEKISKLFEKTKPVHDNLLRQALLTIGDYTQSVGDYQTLSVNDPNEAESTPSMKRLFSDNEEIVQCLLDSIVANRDIGQQLKTKIAMSNVPQNDWRYCFIKYPELFKLMSAANLRLRKVNNEMLIVPNKSTRGYTHMVFLAALSEALKENDIKTSMEAERGTWAEHWMWIGNTEDAIYAKYKNGTFTIFCGMKDKDDDNEKLFSTETDNPIDEAAKYVVEELI